VAIFLVALSRTLLFWTLSFFGVAFLGATLALLDGTAFLLTLAAAGLLTAGLATAFFAGAFTALAFDFFAEGAGAGFFLATAGTTFLGVAFLAAGLLAGFFAGAFAALAFALVGFADLGVEAFFFAVMGMEFRQNSGSTKLGKHFGTSGRYLAPGLDFYKLRHPTPTAGAPDSGCMPREYLIAL